MLGFTDLALALFLFVGRLLVFLVLLMAVKLCPTLALQMHFRLYLMSTFIVFLMVYLVLYIGLKTKFEPFSVELKLVSVLFAVALALVNVLLAVTLRWTFLVRFLLVMLFLIHLVLHSSAPLLVGWTLALVAKMRFVENQLLLYLFVNFGCAL